MNTATRRIAATLGTIFGISGMTHGFFEALQGNTPTGGMFISAIGEAQRMWPHGNEYAFTIIPNFLFTGIAAMLVGLAIIVWSLVYIHKKNGAIVLLLLFTLLLLVGGGVAQILFFPWICLVASRINKPLVWWRKKLPGTFLSRLGKAWLWSLVTGSTIMVFVLVIGITGFVPGIRDAEAVMTVMLVCLASELVILPLIFIPGFAHDITVGRRDQI